jgi:predicted metalloendopeptidase
MAKAPGLDWPTLLEAAGLKDAPIFVIWHPKAIPGLSALTATEPLDAWKDWFAFHALERAASVLPKAFIGESFNFYGPRWQRGMDYTSAALGQAVGKLYVERYFPAATKAKVQAMVADLVYAFGKRIDALTWMTPETKTKAKQKLATLKVGVGYPDRWRDYSGLEIVKGDAFGNAERADLFEYRHQLGKLSGPRRMVDDPANRERSQSALAKRAEFFRGHTSAAVFRSGRRRSAQLRRNGSGDRS